MGRVIATYIHCSLIVGVAKGSSLGLLLNHSSIVKSGIIICLATFKDIIFIYCTVIIRRVALENE